MALIEIKDDLRAEAIKWVKELKFRKDYIGEGGKITKKSLLITEDCPGLLFNILPVFILSSIGITIVAISRSTNSIWKNLNGKDAQDS